ncbi:MAG: hypothetical protein ACRCYO_13680 [Bacteroidia bacterium]
MRNCLLFLIMLLPLAASAQVDTSFLSRLNGTNWELTKQIRPSKIFHRKTKTLRKETMRFSDNQILIDQTDLQMACTYAVANNKELVLSCAVPAQTKYVLLELNAASMTFDIYQRRQTKTGMVYVRTVRVTYKRI